MITSSIVKINKNGTITLPKEVQKYWEGAEILIFPSRDTLIVKKIQKPLIKLSDLASKISYSKMTKAEIDKEIQSYRKSTKK